MARTDSGKKKLTTRKKPVDTTVVEARVMLTGQCNCATPFGIRLPRHERVALMSIECFCHTCKATFLLKETEN